MNDAGQIHFLFLCYSVSQSVISSGEISVVLMNNAGQLLSHHCYATLYHR